jgi:hypothetical protein
MELVAIEEVADRERGTLDRVLAALGASWRVAWGKGGRVGPCAFLWNSRSLELLESGRELGADGLFAAPAMYARFRTTGVWVTITVIAVNVERNVPMRGRQDTVRGLARAVQQVRERTGAEDCVIVMGGFTLNATDASFEPLLNADSVVRVSDGWAAVDIRNVSTSDQMFLLEGAERRWKGAGGVIRFDDIFYDDDDEKAERHVSDHRPIWLGLQVPRPLGTSDK